MGNFTEESLTSPSPPPPPSEDVVWAQSDASEGFQRSNSNLEETQSKISQNPQYVNSNFFFLLSNRPKSRVPSTSTNAYRQVRVELWDDCHHGHHFLLCSHNRCPPL